MQYGITVYQGMFGKGKTYFTFSQVYKAIIEHGQNPYVIANIPYSFVDLFFSSVDSLQSIVSLLSDYIRHTNKDIRTYHDVLYDAQRPIVVIIDEAHLYFNSRDWGSGQLQAILKPLSQCRKRKIKFIVITQNVGTIDKGFRVLADYTIKLDTVHFLFRELTKARTYYNPGDILDIDTQSITLDGDGHMVSSRTESLLHSSEFFFSMSDGLSLISRFHQWYHILASEKYNTLYVTGLEDDNINIPSLPYYCEWDGYHDRYNSMFPDLTNPPFASLPGPLLINKKKRGVDNITE